MLESNWISLLLNVSLYLKWQVLPYCLRSESACYHWHGLCMTCQTEAQNSNMPAAHCELFHLRSIPVHSFVLSFALSRSPSHSRCHICSFHYARIFEFGIDLHSSEFAFTERIAQFWLKYQPPVVDSLSLACIAKKETGQVRNSSPSVLSQNKDPRFFTKTKTTEWQRYDEEISACQILFIYAWSRSHDAGPGLVDLQGRTCLRRFGWQFPTEFMIIHDNCVLI